MLSSASSATGDARLIALGQMHHFFDSSFPSGTFAHSYGFETYASASRTIDLNEAIEWVRNFMVFSLWHADLENISRILEIDVIEDLGPNSAIAENDRAIYAGRSTRDGRLAAKRLAQSLRVGANTLYPEANLGSTAALFYEPSTITALVARNMHWPADATRLLYLQSHAMSLTSVLVRHARIGQSGALAMMSQLTGDCAALAFERPSSSSSVRSAQCWTIERDQIRHQHLSPRLFQS